MQRRCLPACLPVFILLPLLLFQFCCGHVLKQLRVCVLMQTRETNASTCSLHTTCKCRAFQRSECTFQKIIKSTRCNATATHANVNDPEIKTKMCQILRHHSHFHFHGRLMSGPSSKTLPAVGCCCWMRIAFLTRARFSRDEPFLFLRVYTFVTAVQQQYCRRFFPSQVASHYTDDDLKCYSTLNLFAQQSPKPSAQYQTETSKVINFLHPRNTKENAPTSVRQSTQIFVCSRLKRRLPMCNKNMALLRCEIRSAICSRSIVKKTILN
ncbi:hypothetical protein HELRODRAFT_171825 [Helobdella robusta]|uniref:Secreted protein n=1 Tax=Helobdella robusta TaxID=6412 RepID=T1F4Q9_HELRO|nr:hypothetical protein HELRODRAFT_171825 [Helobdella robusta]ESO05423.1 hypothetical protein HELRODRAFT_171825 [Helobdella robusta]